MKTTQLHRLAIAPIVLAALVAPNLAFAQDGEATSERRRGVDVTPYIEASQIAYADVDDLGDVVTYTRLAAGVDAELNGRNTHAGISLRYERHVGWDDDAPDGDVVSGIARASVAIVPRAVTIEAGGIATRANIEGNGATILSPLASGDNSSQIYSGYVGPSVNARMGAIAAEGHYRFGYTKVEMPDDVLTPPGAEPADVFDDSSVHQAQLTVGTRAGDGLPIGVTVGGGWVQEDISNFDQRIKDRHVRGDVAVPLGRDLQVVAGVGYEDVQVSHRDVVRDSGGVPVLDGNGNLQLDTSAPRQIAYETSGLIYDAGVIWRPSRRTALEAHVGRRYDSMTYYGSFAWSPDSRSSLNVAVYDGIAGFGGALTTTLAELPTSFEALRNPVSGDLAGCVQGAGAKSGGGSCFGGGFGSIRSAAFRSRGVAVSYGLDMGRTGFALGAGYDRRKFIGAEGTILETANGVVDENIWVAANLNRQLDRRSNLSLNAYGNWFESGFEDAGSAVGYGASLAYSRDIWAGLSGTMAVSVDGLNRDDSLDEDLLTAAALAGLRYSF